MIIDFKCEVKKGISDKTKKPYYTLTIGEIGKTIFLSETEAKLLSLLHPFTPDNENKNVKE